MPKIYEKNCINENAFEKNKKTRGTTWVKDRGYWKVAFKYKRKIITFGKFRTEEEAHAAYLEKLQELQASCSK